MEATKTAMPSNAEEGGEEEVEGGVRKARERKKKERRWRDSLASASLEFNEQPKNGLIQINVS